MAQQQQAWRSYSGSKRIAAEFKSLSRSVTESSQAFDFALVGDSLFKWRFKLHNFDEDLPGGKQLNADLAQLQRRHGMGHLLMEISFPQDYPTHPFFLRVVKPRCMWYTGHVTAGGSICIEALTLSGTEGSWRPDYSVESILQVVIANMQDCEQVYVQTASGPGGLSGPLRIDLQGRYCAPMMEYSEAEAKAAFSRMQAHHAANGWGTGGVDDAAGSDAGGAGGASGSGSRGAALAFGGGWGGAGPRFGGGSRGLPASGRRRGDSIPPVGGMPGPSKLPGVQKLGSQPMQPGAAAAAPDNRADDGDDGGAGGPVAQGQPLALRLPASVKLPGASEGTMKRLAAALSMRRSASGGAGGSGVGGGGRSSSGNAGRDGAASNGAGVAAVAGGAGDGGGNDDAGITTAGCRTRDKRAAVAGAGSKRPGSAAFGNADDGELLDLTGLPTKQPRSSRPATASAAQKQDTTDKTEGPVDLSAPPSTPPGGRSVRQCTSHGTAAPPPARPPPPEAAVAGAAAAGAGDGHLPKAAAAVVDLTLGSEEQDAGHLALLAAAAGDAAAAKNAAAAAAGGSVRPGGAARRKPAKGDARAGGSAAGPSAAGGSGTAAATAAAAAEEAAAGPSSRAAKGNGPAGASGTGAGAAKSPVPKLRALLVARGADETTVDELLDSGMAPEDLGAAMGVPDIQSLISDDEADDDGVIITLMDPTPGERQQGGRAKKRVRTDAGSGAGPSSAAGGVLSVQEVHKQTLVQDGKLADVLAELEALRKHNESLKARCSNLEKVAAAPVEGAFRAPLPAHWEAMSPDEETTVKLVPLPLPDNQAGVPQQSQEERDAASADPNHLQEMTSNGIPRHDAIAALAHASNDLDKAYDFHFNSIQHGGAAKVLKAERAKKGRGARGGAQQQQLHEAEAAMRAEAEGVLRLFLNSMRGGLGRPRAVVKRIERVQNWRLLSKFEFRSREVAELCGGSAHLNQEQLWHGSGRLDNIIAIVQGGFDHRLSQLSGALGAGTYFAKDASYSDAYARNSMGGAVAAAAAIRGGTGPSAGPAGFFNGMAAAMFGGWAGGLAPPPVAPPVAAVPAWNPGPAVGGSGGRKRKKGGGALGARNAAVAARLAQAQAPVDGAGHTWAGRYAMLLCNVTLGRIGRGMPGLRRPAEGFDSVSASGAAKLEAGGICSVFDNAQAYPMYIIHYD